MYQALKKMLAFSRPAPEGWLNAVYAEAQAALDKARGEQSTKETGE
jgi:hypothetical protein